MHHGLVIGLLTWLQRVVNTFTVKVTEVEVETILYIPFIMSLNNQRTKVTKSKWT